MITVINGEPSYWIVKWRNNKAKNSVWQVDEPICFYTNDEIKGVIDDFNWDGGGDYEIEAVPIFCPDRSIHLNAI